MDDSKLLQKSNLTGGSHAQSRYTSNLTLPHQASEGLINLRGFPKFASLTRRELISPAPMHKRSPTILRTIPN